ncbi:unnamed protein product [Allacma fusca]|uniref:Uncharacterized protein n=1 Tax=Allacma fusca TaxID=39272 RepID=A0A8J2JUA1_9HEXA|nr:unnamed protein product [Allacma fusca]
MFPSFQTSDGKGSEEKVEETDLEFPTFIEGKVPDFTKEAGRGLALKVSENPGDGTVSVSPPPPPRWVQKREGI